MVPFASCGSLRLWRVGVHSQTPVEPERELGSAPAQGDCCGSNACQSWSARTGTACQTARSLHYVGCVVHHMTDRTGGPTCGEVAATLPMKSMPSTVRLAVVAAAGVSVLAIPMMAGSKPPSGPRTTFVELDAVVLDRNNRPVKGLQQRDFQVKEDGRPVAVTRVSEVSAAGIAGRADGRSVVLLLDDNAVPLNATSVVQNIAKLFTSYARPADTIAVVRLTHREDEAAGDLQVALDRIAEYQAGSLSFFGRDMRDDSLQTVTRVARQLLPFAHRRNVLVCIGNRDVCDPYFEQPETSLLWDSWRDALSASARANASVYALSPAGVESRIDLGEGLVEDSGGGDFSRSNDFRRAAGQIWDEAGHYYLLGYTAAVRPRDLHTIDVSVKRSGLHVRARRRRGD
jgi:VWFA-related protein